MAGEWIKMRTGLLTSPKVNGIARMLESNSAVSRVLSISHNRDMREIVTRSVMRHVTVSSLLVIWGAANEHTKDGVFENADLADINDMAGIPFFAEAMQSVGWLEYDEENHCVILPNFNEYNTSEAYRSATAKSSAQRQKEYRDRKKQQNSVTSDVTRDVTNSVTSDVTRNRRVEESREDITTTTTPLSPPTENPSPENSHPVYRWNPGTETLNAIRKQGVPDKFIDEQTPEFRAYWSARHDRPLTYDAKFIAAMTSSWRRVGHNWSADPPAGPGGKRNPGPSDFSWDFDDEPKTGTDA